MSAVRVTLNSINDELAKHGYGAPLKKGAGYFYFSGREAAAWLSLTANGRSAASRKAQSKRMKEYWAKRRTAK